MWRVTRLIPLITNRKFYICVVYDYDAISAWYKCSPISQELKNFNAIMYDSLVRNKYWVNLT